MRLLERPMISTTVLLLSVVLVCLFAGGAAAQSQSAITVEVADSTNGNDTATVGIEIADTDDTDSGNTNFSNEAFTQEQFTAVFGTDGEQTQDELSSAINTWFNSDTNTVNNVTLSQDELSGLINYWFSNL